MRSLLAIFAAAALSTGALAQSDKDHAAHAVPAPKAPTRGQMNMQTNAMQGMHEKMMAAKTREERQALMAERWRTSAWT